MENSKDSFDKIKKLDSNDKDIKNKDKDNDKDASLDNKSSVLSSSKESLLDDHKDNNEDSIQSSDEYNVDPDATLIETNDKKKYKGKVIIE